MTLVLSFWYTVEILNRLCTCVLLRLWLMTEQARRLRPSSIFCIANLYRSLVYGFGTKRWYSSPAQSTFLIWYNAETESLSFARDLWVGNGCQEIKPSRRKGVSWGHHRETWQYMKHPEICLCGPISKGRREEKVPRCKNLQPAVCVINRRIGILVRPVWEPKMYSIQCVKRTEHCS